MKEHHNPLTSSAMALLLAYVLTAVAGCQQYAKITWHAPEAVEVTNRTPLAVGDLAVLNRRSELWDRNPGPSTIGKHTWTAFALPAGNINANPETPIQQSFDQAVRDALQAAGYELVDAVAAPQDWPVLRGEVNRCWWWSYTWLWPFVIEGGQNRVTLFLEDRDGELLWKQSFARSAPGFPVGGAYAFDLMIKWSMTRLVKDIVRECSSDEFRDALANHMGAMPAVWPAK